MNEQAALLAAIVEYSDEDTPRLMYADWLDENGEPVRAEFIRLQIELERRQLAKPWTDERTEKYSRFRELIVTHATQWTKDLGIPRTRAIFRRGFIEQVTCTYEELPKADNPFLLREPLRTLTLSTEAPFRGPTINARPVLETLAAWPIRGRFHTLELNDLIITHSQLLLLLSAPSCAMLRELRLRSSRLEPGAIIAFAECAQLTELEVLELGRLEITPEEGSALARTPHLPKLKQLDLLIPNIPREAEDATPDPMGPVIAELRSRYRGVWY